MTRARALHTCREFNFGDLRADDYGFSSGPGARCLACRSVARSVAGKQSAYLRRLRRLRRAMISDVDMFANTAIDSFVTFNTAQTEMDVVPITTYNWYDR